MKNTYTRTQVEEIVRAYHEWISQFGVLDADGNDQDMQLAMLNVYSHLDEDADQMPFSEAIGVFFAQHVEIDEKGHPLYTPFNETLKEVTKNQEEVI